MADSWEWGYGAPAGGSFGTPPTGEEYGWGYGDPAGGAFGDGAVSGGYGSKFDLGATVVTVLPLPFGSAPDDGGILITLRATWPDAGPYRFRFVNVNGNTFPSDGEWCWSGVEGQGYDCYTDHTQESVQFVLPVLPPQDFYDVRVYSGPTWLTTFDVADVVPVVYRQRSPTTYRLRSTLPPWMATGPRTLRQESLDLATFPGAGYVGVPSVEGPEWPHGPLKALLHATGEILRATVGTPATRLTAELAPGDTVAHVESTLEFGTSGAFWLASTRFTYTGKTDYTLTGVTTGVDRVTSFAIWTDVLLEAQATPFGAVVAGRLQAMRDTTVRHATGDDLIDLSEYLGLPYIDGWDQPSWRLGLQALAMGPRAMPGGTWGFLRGVFSFAEVAYEVTRAAANPQRITRTAGVFADDDAGRLFEIDGELYYSVGPSGAVGAFLELAPVATSYWSAAQWTASDTVTATRLAFTIEEPTPGHNDPAGHGMAAYVIVRVWLDALEPTPPTYLQPTGATNRPVGEPYGGQLQENEFEDGNQVDGPFPPYLFGPGVLGALADTLKASLPPGFWVAMRRGKS